ncbi:hypothetical protein FI667_g7665, partial [Globisporangium splendens]
MSLTLASPAASPSLSSSTSSPSPTLTPPKRSPASGDRKKRIRSETERSFDGVDKMARLSLLQEADGLQAYEPGVDIFVDAANRKARSERLSKTDEVRFLRDEVKRLSAQLHNLVDKWRTEIPHESLLLVACEAAKARWFTAQSETAQQRLKDQLLLQQLYLASLQHVTTESPLTPSFSSRSIFHAIHDPIQLCASDTQVERIHQLLDRSATALRVAQPLLDKFTNEYIDYATPLMPYLTTNITSDKEFTYLSVVSVTKIERATVDRVYTAVLQYYNTLDTELARHYGVKHDIEVLYELSPTCNYSQIRYSSGSPFASVSNTVFATSKTSTMGLIVLDFVDEDEMFPELSYDESLRSTTSPAKQRRDFSTLLSIAPMVDPETAEPSGCILVRCVQVYRFNMRPSTQVVLNEIKLTQAYSNGDLFMAAVVQSLQESYSLH